MLRRLADAHAQQDPTFRTSLTYTRLTAQAALQALRAGPRRGALALAQYHGRGLESDGLSVAQGGQGQAQKKLKETDAIFDNIKKMIKPWP